MIMSSTCNGPPKLCKIIFLIKLCGNKFWCKHYTFTLFSSRHTICWSRWTRRNNYVWGWWFGPSGMHDWDGWDSGSKWTLVCLSTFCALELIRHRHVCTCTTNTKFELAFLNCKATDFQQCTTAFARSGTEVFERFGWFSMELCIFWCFHLQWIISLYTVLVSVEKSTYGSFQNKLDNYNNDKFYITTSRFVCSG